MQPTEEQVQRTLADLRRRPLRACSAAVDPDVRETSAGVPNVAAEVAEVLSDLPPVRAEMVERARRRLESGEQPSDAELAERVVGRLVCDRLR